MPEKTQIQLVVERTNRQKLAWQALDDPKIRRVLYGGAKGGGKSYLLCVWAFTEAYKLIVEHKLKPTKNPIHIGWLGRKQATDFTATTLQTWRRIIPEEYYEIKGGTEKDPKHILIMGRIAIDYGGLDRQETINKFNSAEYAFFAIDQAEETNRDDVSVLQGSLRLKIKGKALNYKELYTANPAACWLKDEFINNQKSENLFVPALPGDNPHLPDEYAKTLEGAFAHRPELLQAYLFGSWDSLDGATQVIKASWINAAKIRTPVPEKLKHYLVCDTARFGDDETVIGRFINTDCVEKLVFGQTKSTEISSRLAIESNKHGKIPIVIEAVGSDLGAAVVDELGSLGYDAIVYCPQAASTEMDPNTGKPKFYNVRAEAWWKAAMMLADGFVEWNDVKYTVSCNHIDTETTSQLLQPKYDFKGGKLIIEPKSQIKDRIGRSPDHADMFVIGLWAFDKVDQVGAVDVLHRYEEDYEDSYEPLSVNF